MWKVETASTEDFAELKELWRTVFDEEPRFLETYFRTRFDPSAILLVRHGGRIASSLHALPLDAGGVPSRFIVGAATRREERRQGMMGDLLEAARETYRCPLFLYPEESARPLYRAHGFRDQRLTAYALEASGTLPLAPCRLTKGAMDGLYRARRKVLERDGTAWAFLADEFDASALVTDGAYALVRGTAAIESGSTDDAALEDLAVRLGAHGVREIRVFGPASLPLPSRTILGGMGDTPDLDDVYIGEQY